MPPFSQFLHSQLIVKLPVPATSFEGQTVIVTGSNTGLGFEAAKYFAKLRASKVILAVRSLKNGENAKALIEQSTSCGSNVVEVWTLNLSSYDSVKEFAERVNKELPRVDVLLENAGKGTFQFSKEEDNESTITVNVISTVLLALLLLPKLKKTALEHNTRPTLTFVTSELHGDAAFAERKIAESNGIEWFDALADEAISKSKMMDRYNISKLLLTLAVQKLGMLTEPANEYPLTINSVAPGLCESDLQRELTGALGVIFWFFKKAFARTTEEGSRTLVNAAGSGVESHGQYLMNCKVYPTGGLTKGKDANAIRDRVWRELSQKLDRIQPGVTTNI